MAAVRAPLALSLLALAMVCVSIPTPKVPALLRQTDYDNLDSDPHRRAKDDIGMQGENHRRGMDGYDMYEGGDQSHRRGDTDQFYGTDSHHDRRNRLNNLRKGLDSLRKRPIFRRRGGEEGSEYWNARRLWNREERNRDRRSQVNVEEPRNRGGGRQRRGGRRGNRSEKVLPATCRCVQAPPRGGVCWDFLPGSDEYCSKRQCTRRFVCVQGRLARLTCIRRKIQYRVVPTSSGRCEKRRVQELVYMYVPYASS